MQDYISGIQQIGIGVSNAEKSLRDYASLFGMDVLVFNDISDATLMTQYTGGNIYKRQALLSLNMQGGGGFEIWQFKNREPQNPCCLPTYGDIGIYAAKMKTSDVRKTYEYFSLNKNLHLSPLSIDAKEDEQFWIKDESNNIFNIVNGNHWFQHKKKPLGGVTGAVIGVSNMENAFPFYQSLLNTAEVIYDVSTTVEGGMDTNRDRYRRVLLQKHPNAKGAFGKLLGSIELELVQCLDRTPNKIYENRYWGDCGFIHLCFDVFNMCGLKKHAEESGYRFTVDSINSFNMESASGRFCYMEDPDGTLMELVETHKVPIYKKMGLYLDLKKRNLEKPLPDWMIKLLALSKVK